MSAIGAMSDALAGGRTTAQALATEAIARAHAAAPVLNATITIVDPNDAGQVAPVAGSRLAGIPYAHKDIFCTNGVRTTAGSRMLEAFVPPYDATVHEKLVACGARMVAKANMDEFAMGSSTEHSYFGPAKNPWDLTRVPGGSSGGSAALVAAGVVPFATGTDTGGSVRQPAAFCGVTGLKPTYGRVSRYGMIAFASSLDQAGVFARSAIDCAHVLAAIAGHDARDATSVPRTVDDYVGAIAALAADRPLAGRRIGILLEHFGVGVEAAVADRTHAALRVLEAAGATLVDVSIASLAHAIPAYYVIAPAEASANLSRYDGVRYGHRASAPANLEDLYTRSRDEGFGAEVKRRIFVGAYVLSAGYYDAYYRRAQQVRRLIVDDFRRAFGEVDLVAGPTTPTPAFKLGEKADPIAMYAADINTVAANLAGLPAISLPAGFVDGLPVGLQLMAPAFGESALLEAGHALQQRTDHHARRPGAFHVGH